MDPLVIPGREQVFCGNNVETLETRKPREQVIVAGPQPAAIRCLVGDRDDHVTIHGCGVRARSSKQQCTKPVLVDATCCGNSLLEAVECRGEKPRQTQQPFGSSIGVCARFQTACQQPLERGDGTSAAAQLVVKRQDFADESCA